MSKEIKEWRDTINADLSSLSALTSSLQNEEYHRVVSDLQESLDDPFLFVIVGEVKAGKSSFVNALLRTEKDICAVAPSPMTDKIQQIQFGEEFRVEEVNPYFHRIYHPEEVLKHIAVVDTPGTNTIVDHHQEVTERFVPVSDLIVFVFEAKNPYRKSAWDFLQHIRDDWRKKIIFVLQQKDLMTEADLNINVAGVRSHAISNGITDPVIFPVSALQEREGRSDLSGFPALRTYLEENISGPKAYIKKLSNYVETAHGVMNQLDQGIRDRERQLELDLQFRKEVQEGIVQDQSIASNQVKLIVNSLTHVYETICTEAKNDLNKGLQFFSLLGKSIGSIFSKSSKPHLWIETRLRKFEADLKKGMNDAIGESHQDLTTQIKQMVRNVQTKIEGSETVLSNDHDIFAHIARDREEVIHELNDTFIKFVTDGQNFMYEIEAGESKSFIPQVATGSGLAVIGIILASVTQVMVVDITGGVLSGIGLIFAGVTVSLKRRRLMREFEAQIDEGRERLHTELGGTLKHYVEEISQRIVKQFGSFDALLEGERIATKELRSTLDKVHVRFGLAKKELGKLLYQRGT